MWKENGRKNMKEIIGFCEHHLPRLLRARTPEGFLHFELLTFNIDHCFQGRTVRQGKKDFVSVLVFNSLT